MGGINNHVVDNGDVEVQTLDFLFESSSESVPDLDTTPIKSSYEDEMNQVMELFHSEYENNILDVDLQMLQDWQVVPPS